jgi:outer membrane protein assembly factor BamB
MLAFIFINASLSGQTAHNSWPGYRGPDDNGHSRANNVPLHWSDSTHVAWKTAIPGRGWSSPVIMEGKVWITTAEPDGTNMRVIGVDAAKGTILHNITVFNHSEFQETHQLNSFASPSPVVEPGRVYVHFGTYGTACLDTRTGSKIWSRDDINCEHEVGPGSSPFIYNNLLILTMDGTDVQYLIALDKNTGKTVWKTPRNMDYTGRTPDTHKAYTTPVIARVNGTDQLISPCAHAVMAYDPLTGKEIWRVQAEGFSASARPVTSNGLVYVNTGFSPPSVVAIKLEGTGNKTENAVTWMNKRNLSARSSPLLIDGLFYMVTTGGLAKCLDPLTGEEIWSQRVGGETSASPVFAGGRIYTFDESGLTTVFTPGRQFTKIAENSLPDGFMASPAVVDGALFLRTKTHLYEIISR